MPVYNECELYETESFEYSHDLLVYKITISRENNSSLQCISVPSICIAILVIYTQTLCTKVNFCKLSPVSIPSGRHKLSEGSPPTRSDIPSPALAQGQVVTASLYSGKEM